MPEKIREYKQDEADVLNTRAKVELAMATGHIPELKTLTIAESNIATFCKGCDHCGTHGKPCKTVGANDQARYVAREWCGWADINGKRVIKSGPNGEIESYPLT